MAIRLIGLSDEEIERLYKLPRVSKSDMFAECAVQARIPTFRFEHPGKYMVFNCKTLVHTFGNSLNEALDQHYGPPGPAGNPFVYLWLKPRD